MDQSLINRIVEAALLASSQPLSLPQLRELFTLDEPAPAGAIEAALEALQADCASRGVELVEVASGFRYQVQADVHAWIARLSTERQTRYTRATLETLALIAYRQPITRGEIEQVRGVTVSSNIIKALEEREWIRVVGHRDVPGRPALFGTTKTFLDYFGLKRLDELPPLSELRDIGELEPQLQLDGASGVSPRIALGGIGEDAAAGNDDDGGISDDAADEAEAGGNEGAADAVPTQGARGGEIGSPVDAEADLEGDAAADEDEDEDEDAEGDLDFRRERPVVFHDDDYNADESNPDDENNPASEAEQDTDGALRDVPPETAPGLRAVHENDHEQDNAVETTTVPELTTASNDAAESNHNDR